MVRVQLHVIRTAALTLEVSGLEYFQTLSLPLGMPQELSI
jgi:hypothetical protein